MGSGAIGYGRTSSHLTVAEIRFPPNVLIDNHRP